MELRALSPVSAGVDFTRDEDVLVPLLLASCFVSDKKQYKYLQTEDP